MFLLYNLLKWILIVEVFSTINTHFSSLRHAGGGGGGYNIKTLQPIAILTSYITLEGYSAMTLQPIAILTFYIMLEGYSAMIPQPIAILSSYGMLRGYNITLLQPIVISTAYNTLGTLHRNASTTNSHSSSLEHYWGERARTHYNQYLVQKSTTHWGDTTQSL